MDLSTVILLLSVLGFAHSFECPRSNARGLFSNGEDCSKYYQCVGGGKYYAKNCPPGLWFDSRYSICNWPGYVSCHTQKPQIQPLASEEDDPVITGKIGRYPQKLGRQIHTTKKTPTYKTKPTTTQRTTLPVTSFQSTELAASWEQDVQRSPQAEKYTTLLDGTTRDPSPGPISSPQSVLDWLYEDHQPDEEEMENVHPEAPTKEKVEGSPINSVAAAIDEYGGFDVDYDDDNAFALLPECAAAFSLMLDPKRCEGFYQCYLWIPYPKVCPVGLLFDHKSNVCNWPEYVYCLNGERYEPPETTTIDTLDTTPETPPVPSNNFDPQGNYGYDEENDPNYDEYWPIEGIEEGDRQQTAFKKKIIPEASSQAEGQEATIAPKPKDTTLKKTRITTPMVKCGNENKCETQTVQTSDYKRHPKQSKSLPNVKSSEEYSLSTLEKDTTVKSTRSLPTESEKLNFPKSPYAKPKESNASSHSDSKSSVKSLQSSDSSFASSEEDQTGAESDSSEETNDIIEIKLTANNFESKQNNIQVEIVPVKDHNDSSDDENKQLQQGSEANATSTEVTEPAPEPTANPVTEVTEAPEVDAGNATSAEGSGGASNGTSAQSDGNSTESAEGSGIPAILSKIDTLRNSVEKLLTETKPPPITNTTKSNSTTKLTLNVATDNKGTEGNYSSVMSTEETTNQTNNVTDLFTKKTKTTEPMVINNTMETVSMSPDVSNTTDFNETSTNSSDSVVDYSNSTVNATTYVPESDSAAYRANNTEIKDDGMDTKYDIKDMVKTGNVTKEPQNNTNNVNVTLFEDITTVTLNISSNETVIDSGFNLTTILFEVNTESTNTTNEYGSRNTTDVTSQSPPPSTTVCSDGACNSTDGNTTRTETQSTALASSKAVIKPNPARPDIVRLSGKSPIARILEKLLNIRMKQIGNNKFKAVSNKQKMGKGGLHSENKLPTSPTPEQADVASNVSSKPSKSLKSTIMPSQATVSTSTKASNKSSPKKTEASNIDNITDTTDSINSTSLTTNVTDVTNNSTEYDTLSVSGNTTLVDTITNNQTVMYSDTTVDHTSDSNQTNTTTVAAQTDATTSTRVTTLKSTNDNSTDNTTTTDFETPQTTKAASAHIHTTEANASTTQETNDTTTASTTQETNDTTTKEIAQKPLNATEKMNTTVAVEQPDANVTETDLKNITIGKTIDLVISKVISNATVLNSTKNTNDSSASTTEKPVELNLTQTNEALNVTIPPEAMNDTDYETTTQANETSVENKTSFVTKIDNSSSIGTTIKSTTKSTEKSTTKDDSTSTKQTTEKSSTLRKGREASKLSAEASRFRLHVKAPHFEARKVFGGPDERWRFSDGTLVDPFSRRQRDVNTETQYNSASFNPSSFLLIAIMTVVSQLA